MKNTNLRRLTVAALFGAMAFVLIYFSFSIPVISVFAEFDASAVPEAIGGFILGPIGAIEIIAVKLILKLLFKGSSSMMTGEIQNFLLSVTYVLPAVFYYQRHKTKKGAVIGLTIGSVLCIIMAVVTNVYMIFPAYMKLYGMDWGRILEMSAAANPWIKDVPSLVAFSIVPFNVLSRGFSTLVTILVYKRVSLPIKKMIQQ